ncbi:hypothetical protein [Chryseobacterium sp.]|uniref:hypothetical protein n=1 Tax=Chryseobacterium sp. TaxID=1871047 RepID=UPI0012A99400|nr:hypothetical protein [Chryseobacterium sp.]QFG52663.1 hypothetical protein F7R58_03565 [Chryseobacterium sp.]
MDFKTSLLIYRAQTINERKIWKSKIRLVKSLTPIIRQLTNVDFQNIDHFKTQENLLITWYNSSISPLLAIKTTSTDPIVISNIDNQITDFKIQYLEKKELLNSQYKNDKIQQLETFSKYLLLTYCTWSEASFIKLKHTPHGLALNDRFQNYGRNIETKWKTLIDKIIDRIPNIYSGDISQMKSELQQISEDYIVNNSYIRNKIAHGQWDEALNSDNDDINIVSSQDMSFVDVVKIDSTFEIHHLFLEILENISESNVPEDLIIKKNNSYLILKQKLDDLINLRQSWDIKSRATFLQQRTFDTRNLIIADKMHSKGISKEIILEITGVNK